MGLEHGEGDSTAKKYTHKMMVDWCADIRDAWDNESVGGTADTVYIPDKNGTGFKVVFVEMFSQGAPNARKMIYLARKAVTWPSTEV